MKEKHILFQNTSIYYKTTNAGLPVVLVHGFAEDSTVWDNQVEFLKDKYRLIIPDLPGSGRSGMLNTPISFGEGLGVRSKENIGLDDYAVCIKQILSEEKINQCIMIGHSMGGYITLAFAEKFPQYLLAFGLFHSSAYADDAAKVETRQKAIGFIESKGVVPFLQTSIPGLFYDQSNSKLPNALIEKGKAFSAKALIQYYQAMIARPDRTNILETATVPVLFVMGEHDKAVPFNQSLQQSYLSGRSYVYILRRSAHMGMQEEAAKSNETLANFLQAF